MTDSCRASYNCGGQVAFVFRLPTGQVEFSGLFLTLSLLRKPDSIMIVCRVLTRILKTGVTESIPGKSWSQN